METYAKNQKGGVTVAWELSKEEIEETKNRLAELEAQKQAIFDRLDKEDAFKRENETKDIQKEIDLLSPRVAAAEEMGVIEKSDEVAVEAVVNE